MIGPDTLVSDAELASVLSISSRRVRQLAEQGVIERIGRGQYALGPSIVAMLDYAAGTGSELQRERTRKVKADADRSELAYAREKGLVAPLEATERAWQRMMTVIRTNILNVPTRAVLRLIGCTDESTFKKVLKDELTIALTTAAEAAQDPNFLTDEVDE